MRHRKLKLIALLILVLVPAVVQAQTVKDFDGNVYKTVTIGAQTWMAENLKTTKYGNGELIGTTSPATLDISEEINPKYQWAYNGNEGNVATYGRLYTWYAVTDSRGVCPAGWHVPSDTEWTTMTTYLGGERVAGGKLKETGKTHWLSPNTGATNKSGFIALPGGYRHVGGTFFVIGFSGDWWSSTEESAPKAYYRYMSFSFSNIYRISLYEANGFSVRCLKN